MAELVWDMSDDESLWYGLCRADGRVRWFVRDLEGWSLYALQPDELDMLREHKADREFFLGTHASYDVAPSRRQGRGRARAYYAGRNHYPTAATFAVRRVGTTDTLVDPFTGRTPDVLSLRAALERLTA